MPRSIPFRVLLVLGVLAATSTVASADITAFVGTTRASSSATGDTGSAFRLHKGVALGVGLVIVGFEFEWSDMSGDSPGENLCGDTRERGLGCVPSLMTGMGNVLLQTPRGITPVQVYGTVGAGVYRERFDLIEQNDYGVGTNVGGGVKIDLVGPLRLRIDYRIFKLANDAFNKTPQRFYAGANLAF